VRSSHYTIGRSEPLYLSTPWQTFAVSAVTTDLGHDPWSPGGSRGPGGQKVTTPIAVRRIGANAFEELVQWGGSVGKCPMLLNRILSVGKTLRSDFYHPYMHWAYFDARWYLRTYRDLQQSWKKRSNRNPIDKLALRHYIVCGWKEGRNPSPYFNTVWYLQQDPSLTASGIEPLGHYVREGWRLGRSPSTYFNTPWYLKENPDVAALSEEPLQHYVDFGHLEGRDPNCLFDVTWYMEQNPAVAAAGLEPLSHYLAEGWRSGCAPSPHFDAVWYLEQNPDVSAAGREPLDHYLTSGHDEGRDPSSVFKAKWYLSRYPDVAAAGLEPLAHYVTDGARRGYAPRPAFDRAVNPASSGSHDLPIMGGFPGGARNENATALALSPFPLVSVIIPNLNGSRHLHNLFESLRSQTYKNFEIIFVDDNSNDDSLERARALGADHIIQTGQSIGFAGANNVALPKCAGELIALLNNDTRVDPNWLEAMISTIKQSPLVAAVAPKMRFWTKFCRVILKAGIKFSVDVKELISSLEYTKYFIRAGVDSGEWIEAVDCQHSHQMAIDIPLQDGPVKLLVRSDAEQPISITVGTISKTVLLKDTETNHELLFSNSDKREGFYIINNAGSVLSAPLSPADRGFGCVDEGQFDVLQDVDLFCGGAVLIRRDALHGRQLFIDEFVAYYEDAELAMRLRQSGYRIVYCPNAIVYHKHAATSIERSSFWLKYTVRNKILFEYIFSDSGLRTAVLEAGKSHLNHLRYWYSDPGNRTTNAERQFAKEIPTISAEIDTITGLIDAEAVPRSAGLRIGLYNSHWATLGGGEAHALDIADAMGRYGQVELIAENDFDVDHMLRYFGFEKLNVRKRSISRMNSRVTEDYDIFVNACFQSETVSRAVKSFAIIHFPSRNPSREFLQSYEFLADSAYGLHWMRRFWGEDSFRAEVLFPAIPSAMLLEPDDLCKKKIILSVGRFAAFGHTKCQREIAIAFRKLVERKPNITEGWTLVLAGSVNDVSYVSEVREAISGLDARLVTDASFEEIQQLYRDALVYVHASGYGRDQEKEPHLMEHFGMAITQALGSGCVPVVFGAAGPKEIVELAGVGFIYSTIDELCGILEHLLPSLEHPTVVRQTTKLMISGADPFSKSRQRQKIERLIQALTSRES
jgi:GT2 family glycosyltransferase